MYRQCIRKAFARLDNDSLDQICTEIADISKLTNFPNGKAGRIFVCALISKDAYLFMPKFKDEQGAYMEFLLKEKHVLVIKDCFVDTAEE